MHGHAELSKHARLHCRGGFERVRADVFVDLAIRELHESRVDALCLGDLQARVLVNAEGLDVRNERRILPLPSTAWRALTLGARKRLAPDWYVGKRTNPAKEAASNRTIHTCKNPNFGRSVLDRVGSITGYVDKTLAISEFFAEGAPRYVYVLPFPVVT